MRLTVPVIVPVSIPHSHSIVPGGLLVMSYVTRLMLNLVNDAVHHAPQERAVERVVVRRHPVRRRHCESR
jgi:hypothetical protein